jgi:hypothetical protein
LESGTTLVDKSGAGRFLVNAVGAQLRGTVPVGQRITVMGEAYDSNGDNYNGTTLGLGNTTVTNDGTLVLRMSRLPWNFGDGPCGFQATS